MSTKAFRYFKKGIQIQGESSDPSDNLEGSLFVNSSSSRIKAYIEAAVRELVTNDQVQLLKNKSLEDSTTAIVDSADNTKKIKFNAGGTSTTATTISAAQTADRTITLPDNSSELVDLTFAQNLQNKSLVDATTSVVDSTDSTKKIKFDASGTTGTSTTLTSSQTVDRVLTLPDITDTLVGKTTTDVLTNKSLSDSTTSVVDVADNTKKLVFDVQGTTGKTTTLVSASTDNRTITLPDSTDTLIGASTSASLTNKSLVDATTAVVDSVDSTKKIKFDASGTSGTSTTLASSQTADRTITFPDVSGTVVTTGDTGTITGTMIADGTIMNAEINASAAIARSKLASGTNNALQANSATGVLSDVSDITVSTNNFTLANTKHIEAQASTDSATTGTSASLAAFTASAVRLTNIGLTSIANIPAGNNGQLLTLFNRTGNDVTVIDSSAASGTAANRIYTGTSGNITWKKDAAFLLQYDSTSSRWQIIGGTGSGGGTGADVDTFAVQDFENASLTDFTQTGLTLSTSNPIKGTKSALLTHGASTQSFKQTIPVDTKFRGKNLTAQVTLRSTALSSNVTFTVTDETNSAVLTTTQLTTGQITGAFFSTNSSSNLVGVSDLSTLNSISIGASITGSGIPANTIVTGKSSSGVQISNNATATAAGVTLKVSILPANLSISFAVPANCLSLSYTFSALAETGSPETYIDDIQLKLSTAAKTSASITQTTFNSTEWIAYTPTSPNSSLTISSTECFYKREGSDLLLRCKFTRTGGSAFEARISLPTGLTTAGASVIPSLQIAGTWGKQTVDTYHGGFITIEPSVSYFTFTHEGTFSGLSTVDSLSKALGTGVTGSPISLEARIPISGWDTNTTTTTTIPLASSVLVTQPDSSIRLDTFNAYGSTNTVIPRFTNIVESIGSDVAYTDSTTAGASFTIQTAGIYSIMYQHGFNTLTAQSIFGISKNSTQLTTSIASITNSDILVLHNDIDSVSGNGAKAHSVTWTGYLNAGDIVRPHTDGATVTTATSLKFVITKQGSTKIINPSSDQKIAIPTHQLRFEGASARGSTDTAIVKFDTQTITQGDAWEIGGNPSVNGTVITIKKAGRLFVSGSAYWSGGNLAMRISKNQAVLTSIATTSEMICHGLSTSANGGNVAGVVDVIVGDKIRFSTNQTPTADSGNYLSLALQEQSVAVALQNVTPTYDNSDSCVQLRTGNGYGSTATKIKRFSNTVQNFGTDITYIDDPSLGASFTINKDGVYSISFSDFGSATDYIGITLNQSNLAQATDAMPSSELLAHSVTTGTGYSNNVSWAGYLTKGSIIRANGSQPATSNGTLDAKFTISRVGKTSGTVDVTPFVQIPQQDVEAIEALTATSTFGSTNTGVPVLNITKNTNKGIIQVISDSVNGTSFKALKDCEFKLSAETSTSGASVYFTRNATILTAINPDGKVGYVVPTANGSSGSTVLFLNAGDAVRLQRNSATATSVDYVNITATAISSSVATPTQSVSSDTMSFVWSGTALTGNEAIGTFNTYTYAANTNTATIAASAPTQSTSSMNINGIQVFARAYTATSTAASPCRVDVVVGKGLKSSKLDSYANTGKLNAMSIDVLMYSASNWAGTQWSYNETTGILTINAGQDNGSGTTTRYAGVDISAASGTGTSAYASGYFVFNASKAPSLVTIPNLNQRVAYLTDVKSSGSGGGTSVANTWTARVLNTISDPTGIVSNSTAFTGTDATSNSQFILPAGTYEIYYSTPLAAGVGSGCAGRLYNVSDSLAIDTAQNYAATNGTDAYCFNTVQVVLTSSKTFSIQYFITSAQATWGLGQNITTGSNNVFTKVKITKIK